MVKKYIEQQIVCFLYRTLGGRHKPTHAVSSLKTSRRIFWAGWTCWISSVWSVHAPPSPPSSPPPPPPHPRPVCPLKRWSPNWPSRLREGRRAGEGGERGERGKKRSVAFMNCVCMDWSRDVFTPNTWKFGETRVIYSSGLEICFPRVYFTIFEGKLLITRQPGRSAAASLQGKLVLCRKL